MRIGPARSPEEVAVLIVGGGQAGLSAGHRLQESGIDIAIVDAGDRIGDTWRHRWDSLRLFTPAVVSALPGLAMEGVDTYPTKDQVANYLERYAARHDLDVRLSSPVRRLATGQRGYVARVGDSLLTARHVVVATGAHRRPRVPDLAGRLRPSITQLTSAAYRNPGDLPEGPVLVVGAANSGAEIAVDLARAGRTVTLAGRDVGRIPRLGPSVYRAMRHIRTAAGPGRIIARAAHRAGGDPLGRADPRDFPHLGIRRVGRVTSAPGGVPRTADGPTLGDVTSVIWCTGLRPDLEWLRPAAPLGPAGLPEHRSGAVLLHPRLHLLGQPYQRTLASHLLGGVGHDAADLARRVARELRR
jgi:putative flavoprotein involved in K+ transport